MTKPATSQSLLVRTVLGLIAVASVAALSWPVALAIGIYNRAANTSERSAGLQAVAATISLVATLLLLLVTAWYAILTRSILRQSGPIVTAGVGVGWFGTGAVVTGPVASVRTGPPDPRFTSPSWAITVTNAGNAATKVTAAAIEFKSGISIGSTQSLAGPTPPFTLDAHSNETLYIEYSLVINAAHVSREHERSKSRQVIRSKVTLGSGKIVHSNWETLPN